MTDKIRRAWGYSKKDSKIFELAEGESLPDGYFDSPAKIKATKAKTPKTPKEKPADTSKDEKPEE